MRGKNQKTPPLMAIAALVLVGVTAARAEALDGGVTAEGPPTTAPAEEKPASEPGSVQLSDTPTHEAEAIVSGGTITLRSRSAATLGQAMAFIGMDPVARPGDTAVIERYAKASASWNPMAAAQIKSGGGFIAHWHASITGQLSVRANILTAAQIGATRAVSTSAGGVGVENVNPVEARPSGTVSGSAQITVFKPALATYYGPGLYGNHTACGQVLSTALVGVANRKLPCGTLVAVSYGGERLTIPVIDRGPYGDAADWDLTAGAAAALGITGTAEIGTLVVGKTANTPTLGTPVGATGETPAGAGTPEVGVTGGATAG